MFAFMYYWVELYMATQSLKTSQFGIYLIDSAPEGTDLSFTKSFAAVPRKLKKKEATRDATMKQWGKRAFLVNLQCSPS